MRRKSDNRGGDEWNDELEDFVVMRKVKEAEKRALESQRAITWKKSN